jgi:hypothetical protein
LPWWWGSLRALSLDLGALMVFSVGAAVLLRKERVIGRIEGIALRAGYIAFVVLLALGR